MDDIEKSNSNIRSLDSRFMMNGVHWLVEYDGERYELTISPYKPMRTRSPKTVEDVDAEPETEFSEQLMGENTIDIMLSDDLDDFASDLPDLPDKSPSNDLLALEQKIKDMELFEIARIIKQNWKPVYFGAVPYVEALSSLASIEDAYGADSGRSVVAYFIANASTWKGPIAKIVKNELRRRLKKF